jgi:hypothetical protein
VHFCFYSTVRLYQSCVQVNQVGHVGPGMEGRISRSPQSAFCAGTLKHGDQGAGENRAGSSPGQAVELQSFRGLQLKSDSNLAPAIRTGPLPVTRNPRQNSRPQNKLLPVQAYSHQPPRYLYCWQIVRLTMVLARRSIPQFQLSRAESADKRTKVGLMQS